MLRKLLSTFCLWWMQKQNIDCLDYFFLACSSLSVTAHYCYFSIMDHTALFIPFFKKRCIRVTDAMHWIGITVPLRKRLDFVFHLHQCNHSYRSRPSTGSLPGRPLLAYQRGCRASSNACAPPSHQMAHTEEAGAEGSRQLSGWHAHGVAS